MVRRSIIFSVLGALGLAGGGVVAIRPATDQHANFYHIVINDAESCSATAVGPHALLTAEHCITNLKTLSLDGKGIVDVNRIIRDDNDHVILKVAYRFPSWDSFGPAPVQGQEIQMYHAPGAYTDMYARGYVSGARIIQGKRIVLYDVHTFFGSSGAAVLNMDGQIIGVNSVVIRLEGEGAAFQQAGGYDLRFSDEDMAEALK